MSDQLAKNGLFFDELNKIKVIDPEITSKTSELKGECGDFVDYINKFQKIADGFIVMIDSLAQEVEKEKIRAIGARNYYQSMAKQKDAKQLQLKALIHEKTNELERLRLEHQSLMKVENEQIDHIDRLLLNT